MELEVVLFALNQIAEAMQDLVNHYLKTAVILFLNVTGTFNVLPSYDGQLL